MFGPVQLYVTPEVEDEAERVTEDPEVQESGPLALALAHAAVVFSATRAVSVPLQPVAGL